MQYQTIAHYERALGQNSKIITVSINICQPLCGIPILGDPIEIMI
jgi:hypothetical protein